MLYSFDIFDTLITTRTATSQGIFALMQHCLNTEERYREIPAEIRSRFCDLRIEAEQQAQKSFVDTDVEAAAIPEIYNAMANIGDLDAHVVSQLIELELETAVQNVIGIEENIAKVKELRKKGKRVVLVADTHLDETTVRIMLERVDDIFTDIPVYISSTCHKSQSSSSLYNFVRKKEQAEYSAWHHVGNDRHDDVDIPRKLGIHAEYYAFESFWKIEEHELDYAASQPTVQLAIGTARNLRLKHRAWKTPALVGASVSSVILVPYVYWVLERSLEMGIHKLYFIARDGYLPQKIADEIIAKNNWPIETHYIYGSRHAWRVPGYDGSEADMKTLLKMSRSLTVSKALSLADISKALKISVKDVKCFLPSSWPEEDTPLYSETYNWLVHYLSSTKEFRIHLKKKSIQARKLALDYLCQEVDFSEDDFAFVELNGTGFTSKCMANILHDMYSKPIHFFYCNLASKGIEWGMAFHRFLPRVMPCSPILELFCRAMHGQTESYEETRGRLVPILERDEEAKTLLQGYGYEEYMSAVIEFTRDYAEVLQRYGIASVPKITDDYINNILTDPDEKVLSFLADMPFNDTGHEKEIKKYAPKLTKEDIRNSFLFFPDLSRYEGAEMEYSLLRCSKIENKKIAWYRYNRGKVIKRYKAIWGKDLLPPGDDYAPFKDFPFRALGKRFVIYGAGMFGKKLYDEVKKSGCHIVGWLDKNYKKMKEEGLPVTGGVDDLQYLEFDVVWIAVLNQRIVEEIKEKMLKIGILEGKIMHFGKWSL